MCEGILGRNGVSGEKGEYKGERAKWASAKECDECYHWVVIFSVVYQRTCRYLEVSRKKWYFITFSYMFEHHSVRHEKHVSWELCITWF